MLLKFLTKVKEASVIILSKLCCVPLDHKEEETNQTEHNFPEQISIIHETAQNIPPNPSGYNTEISEYVRMREEARKLLKTVYTTKKGSKKVRARSYSQIEEIKRKASELMIQARDGIYFLKNKSSPMNRIDLHGLYKEESTYYLDLKLAELEYTKYTKLYIIVGKGNHSKNNRAILSPYIQNRLKQLGIKFCFQTGNEGIIIANIKS